MPQNHPNSAEAVTGEIAPEPDSPDAQAAAIDDRLHDEFIWNYPDKDSPDAISFEMILASSDWAPYFDEALQADLKILTQFVNGVVELDGYSICCRFTNVRSTDIVFYYFRTF